MRIAPESSELLNEFWLSPYVVEYLFSDAAATAVAAAAAAAAVRGVDEVVEPMEAQGRAGHRALGATSATSVDVRRRRRLDVDPQQFQLVDHRAWMSRDPS